ncbi:unnamed protein product, partial [Pylaiella littoralis]
MLATTEVAVTFGAHRRRKRAGSSTAAVATTREGNGKRWKDRLRLRPQPIQPHGLEVQDSPEPESVSTPRQQGAIGARSAMAEPPVMMLVLLLIATAMVSVQRLRSAGRRAATHHPGLGGGSGGGGG